MLKRVLFETLTLNDVIDGLRDLEMHMVRVCDDVSTALDITANTDAVEGKELDVCNESLESAFRQQHRSITVLRKTIDYHKHNRR